MDFADDYAVHGWFKTRLEGVGSYLSGRGQSNREWTRAVKHALCDPVLDGLHYWAAGTGGDHFGEWLVDLVAFRGSSGGWGARIHDIVLAVECEWLNAQDEILYDFQKLLVIKARHKLMICEAKDGDTGRVVTWLNDCLETYHGPVAGETYHYAVWDERNGAFHFAQRTPS